MATRDTTATGFAESVVDMPAPTVREHTVTGASGPLMLAVVAARTTIIEGAVGMVRLALERLDEHDVVELDEERKAAMVSNLLVVLCGDRDTQPVVNTGSLYH